VITRIIWRLRKGEPGATRRRVRGRAAAAGRKEKRSQRTPVAKAPRMNPLPRSNIASLDEARRLRRTLDFLAAAMSESVSRRVTTIGWTLPDLNHLPGPAVDLCATRAVAPVFQRELTGSADWRKTTTILARMRDPIAGIAEVTFDVAYTDGGPVTLIRRLSLFTPDMKRFWLVGRTGPGEILFRLTRHGLIPTLTQPSSASPGGASPPPRGFSPLTSGKTSTGTDRSVPRGRAGRRMQTKDRLGFARKEKMLPSGAS
jgi:hypothetical protein